MKINVVYSIPPASFKYNEWHDGFTAAMERVAECHQVCWFNVDPGVPDRQQVLGEIFDADAVLVKSDWQWIPDIAVRRRQIFHVGVPVILAISGSTPPPRYVKWAYDALLYETAWYSSMIGDHSLAIQAFGIDTRVMNTKAEEERDIDWLMVGRPMASKRPDQLLDKSGRRVLVGDNAVRANEIVSRLLAGGVEVLDFVSYGDLADLYRRSRNVLVPCRLQGGGERSVLEARACGAHVEIADDNPKLASLLTGPLLTHEDYACAILECLSELEARPKPLSPRKVFAVWLSSFALWGPGALRSAVNPLRRMRHARGFA